MEIPGAEPSLPECKADVVIRYGIVPKDLDSPKSSGICYQVGKNKFLLSVKNVARYLVLNGKEIIVQPENKSRENEVRLFLFGNAIGALMHQRGLLPLHGSAVKVDDHAVLLLGASGTGKSTLAAALMKKGYAILTDDVAVVGLNSKGIPVVHPALPGLQLWADVLEKLEMSPDDLHAVRPELEKYHLALHNSFYKEPLPISRVYCLETTNLNQLKLEPVKTFDKLPLLTENTFRFQYTEGLGMKSVHFQLCVTLGQHVTIRKLIRPSHPFLLEELVHLVETEF
jgi:hypothetical protein